MLLVDECERFGNDILTFLPHANVILVLRDALYRRSVYTFWKRTSPPPSLAAFNAPTREQCTVRRECTNTPIQALVLMNDPQYFEAARRLAETAIRQNNDLCERAKWMLTTVLCRPA